MQQTQAAPKENRENKKDKKQKRAELKPSASDGKHTPFAALAEEAEKKKAEEKAKVEVQRAEEKQKKKEADDKAKRANIYSYLDDVKKRHPNLPAELLDGIKNAKTAGEGKRLLKDYLIKKDAAIAAQTAA